MISRPADSEYAPVYATYISKVPDGDLLNFMELQPDAFDGLINDQAIEPPTPGKWSVKQVLGHVCDTERIMGYRALRFARADKTEIEGFEQDDYVAIANSNARSATELLAELKSVRGATLSLLEGCGSFRFFNSTGVRGSLFWGARALRLSFLLDNFQGVASAGLG